MIAKKLKKKTVIEKIIGSIIAKQVTKPYNKIRKYNLKPIKDIDEMMSKQLNLIPISSHVIQRDPFWEDKNIITGYWYGEDQGYAPQKSLSEFLKSGDKLVILTLGAMSFEDESEKEKLEMFINTFKKTECRAIIQGFQKAMKDFKLPEGMIACGSIPHSWLFRQCLFVIHHSGFVTTASAFTYEIPSNPHTTYFRPIRLCKTIIWCGCCYKTNKSKKFN